MRDPSCWQLTEEVKPIAAENPEALTAALADRLHGGNCGEHAQVAFDYLRVKAVGETINMSAKQGLDHAFVLIGDLPTESDPDIVVADPWPTQATATTWEDHFAYTSDRQQINVHNSMVADGQNVKAVIAAGLTLTEKGKQMAQRTLSDEETEQAIQQGLDDDWIWEHEDAAATGHDYEYYSN
ncbi:MAG: hypothetical protein RIE73_19840 [Coleofasciculus sp. C1-SOL-03]|uniref:hypothetical protein n=1 Tax=Coleofasciculus sp. C1-SOL-03 TaxID=3069522 RepID=UPI0032F15599